MTSKVKLISIQGVKENSKGNKFLVRYQIGIQEPASVILEAENDIPKQLEKYLSKLTGKPFHKTYKWDLEEYEEGEFFSYDFDKISKELNRLMNFKESKLEDRELNQYMMRITAGA